LATKGSLKSYLMAAPAFSEPKQNATRLADPALRAALLKYARRRLPPGEVEDLVQNTLTEALVSNSAPADMSDFERWVYGIARHKIADSYRRRGRLPLLGVDVDVDAPSSDPGPATGELSQWIERELPKTDGAQATLHWLLREGDGESLDEIAREAALPAPRVRQRVSRLRRHLYSRWLALGAAGLALLLGGGALLRAGRKTDVAPPGIRREIPAPIEEARLLRDRALEKCAARAFEACLAGLDQARALDPLGDAASTIQEARSAAGRAQQSIPEPSLPASAEPETTSLPQKAAPKAVRSNPVPKFAPSKTNKKQLPFAPNPKPLPSKKAAPLDNLDSTELLPQQQEGAHKPN